VKSLVLSITCLVATGCTFEVGSDQGDGCSDCAFDPLQAHRAPIASCGLEGAILTCSWADDGLLVAKPFDSLNGAMTIWVRSDERVLSSSNDGRTVVYDLGPTSWDGDRMIIRTTFTGTVDGNELVLGETEQLYYAADLAPGVDLYSSIELWDIGLFSDAQLSPTVGFASSIMDVEDTAIDVRRKASIYRIAVDPSEGLDIYTEGKLRAHADQPGYFFFHTTTSVEYDPEPAVLD